jgi:hypothetical protein
MALRSTLRRLAAAALALAALAPLLERHDGGHLDSAAARRIVEASALHAAAAAHVEAAGARSTEACDLCARLANAGAALQVPSARLAPAPPVVAASHPVLPSPSSAARLGAPAGRAPPLG